MRLASCLVAVLCVIALSVHTHAQNIYLYSPGPHDLLVGPIEGTLKHGCVKNASCGYYLQCSVLATNIGLDFITNISVVAGSDATLQSVVFSNLDDGFQHLSIGQSLNATEYQLFTQAEIDNGTLTSEECEFTITSVLNGTHVVTVSEDLPIDFPASATLVYTSPSVNFSSVGDIIVYVYSVTNTGAVTLLDLHVFDQQYNSTTGGILGYPVSICVIPQLNPGQTLSCSVNHTVTLQDVLIGRKDGNRSTCAFSTTLDVRHDVVFRINGTSCILIPFVSSAITSSCEPECTCNDCGWRSCAPHAICHFDYYESPYCAVCPCGYSQLFSNSTLFNTSHPWPYPWDFICEPINPCRDTPDFCPTDLVNEACLYISPGVAECFECPAGYEIVRNSWNTNFECVDVNECAAALYPCDPHVACINYEGSYECGVCAFPFTSLDDDLICIYETLPSNATIVVPLLLVRPDCECNDVVSIVVFVQSGDEANVTVLTDVSSSTGITERLFELAIPASYLLTSAGSTCLKLNLVAKTLSGQEFFDFQVLCGPWPTPAAPTFVIVRNNTIIEFVIEDVAVSSLFSHLSSWKIVLTWDASRVPSGVATELQLLSPSCLVAPYHPQCNGGSGNQGGATYTYGWGYSIVDIQYPIQEQYLLYVVSNNAAGFVTGDFELAVYSGNTNILVATWFAIPPANNTGQVWYASCLDGSLGVFSEFTLQEYASFLPSVSSFLCW